MSSVAFVLLVLAVDLIRGPAVPLAAQQPVRPPEASPFRISVDDLKRLPSSAVLVVDVRPSAAYALGHIIGAISVPYEGLAARADEIRRLSAGRLIVAYCSCPTDHLSLAAVAVLTLPHGPEVRALAGGYPAWTAAAGVIVRAP
jgi:rhodanese-related sulfurtransferase